MVSNIPTSGFNLKENSTAHLDDYRIPPDGFRESMVYKTQELEKRREAIGSPWTALGLPVPELIRDHGLGVSHDRLRPMGIPREVLVYVGCRRGESRV